jgi:cytochrome c-type biogenesis protein CcmH
METLLPDDPQLLAEFAVILAIANGGDLNGKPTELLQAALKLDPNHRRSLALAGTAAFNKKDYAAAIGYWERLQKTYPHGSESANKAAERIAEARALANASAFAASNPDLRKIVH